MNSAPMAATLSPPRRRLLELMQAVGFGKIEALQIVDGEPRFEPPPRILRTIKFDTESRHRDAPGGTDFALKRQVVELFEQLDRLQTGAIATLEVQAGLPFRMVVEDTAGPPLGRSPHEEEAPR